MHGQLRRAELFPEIAPDRCAKFSGRLQLRMIEKIGFRRMAAALILSSRPSARSALTALGVSRARRRSR